MDKARSQIHSGSVAAQRSAGVLQMDTRGGGTWELARGSSTRIRCVALTLREEPSVRTPNRTPRQASAAVGFLQAAGAQAVGADPPLPLSCLICSARGKFAGTPHRANAEAGTLVGTLLCAGSGGNLGTLSSTPRCGVVVGPWRVNGRSLYGLTWTDYRTSRIRGFRIPMREE